MTLNPLAASLRPRRPRMSIGETVIVLAALFAMAFVAALARADDVDSDEVFRRGDMVVQVGGGIRAQTDRSLSAALTTPEDDSHRWFVTLVEGPGCIHCERLKRDLKTSPALKSWVNLADPKKSWAHFFAFNAEDPTQKWRLAEIKVVGYPTIIVQPPKSKAFGDPSTVVLQQTGYTTPDELSANIRKAIQKYADKISPRRGYQADELPTAIGQAPPFTPPSWPTTTPVDLPPEVTPQPNQPTPTPVTPQSPLTLLFSALLQLLTGLGGSAGTTNVLMLALIGVQLWRAFRKATNQPLLLDDPTFGKLEQLLATLLKPPAPTK